MKKIILGSGSPRRKELLSQIGVPFEVRVSEKEEIYTQTIPKEIVKELALMKAENVASELQAKNTIVIGADTVVVHQDQILGKPKDEQDAFRMIQLLQGDVHQVYTGVAILDFDGNGEKTVISHAVETRVSVNPMSEEEIWKYVQSKEPMDKAGAYGIQGKFSAFIEKIEGDYFNVVGLPVSYVYQMLKQLGEL
ncbi:MAG: Maf family protein [[Ruminococcus] gnavus]|nr:Maf family protein [Mediterraneibacter gnavus]